MKSEMGLTRNFSNPTIWSLEKKMLQIITLEVTTPLERNILMQQWIKCEKLQKIALVCKVFLSSILLVEELDQVIYNIQGHKKLLQSGWASQKTIQVVEIMSLFSKGQAKKWLGTYPF